jgi:hypothetical protein
MSLTKCVLYNHKLDYIDLDLSSGQGIDFSPVDSKLIL